MAPPRYRVLLSGVVKDQLRDAVALATARGQKAETIHAAQKILEALTWLADEVGESRFPLNVMGELRVVVIGPLGAVYAVDRSRLEVQIGRFRLLGTRRG